MKCFKRLFLLIMTGLMITGCSSTPELGRQVSNEEFFRAAENMMMGIASHMKGNVYFYVETNLNKIENSYSIDRNLTSKCAPTSEEAAVMSLNESYSFVSIRNKLLTYQVSFTTYLNEEKAQYAIKVDTVGKAIEQGGTKDYIATYIWEAHGLITYVEETIRIVNQTMWTAEHVKANFSYEF